MRQCRALPIALLLVSPALFAQDVPPERQLARDTYRQLVEIDTTDSAGDNTAAAEAMAARLRCRAVCHDRAP